MANSKFTTLPPERYSELMALPKAKDFLKKLADKGLSHQSRLFYLNNGHPEPRGSITFIRYNFNFFALTNYHCLKNDGDVNNYFVFIPSRKTKYLVENERIKVNLLLVNTDKDMDLALFSLDENLFKQSKRSFFELFPYTKNDFNLSPFVLMIGVPGERLGYIYGENNTDYSNLEKIIMNHITYKSVIKDTDENFHEIPISKSNNVEMEWQTEREENKLIFNESELRGEINRIDGLSGSPCFNYNYKNFNSTQLHFLGLTSNGSIESGTVQVIRVERIKEFLGKSIKNI